MPAAVVTAAVVLAGGRGRRLGGVDKALLPLAGRPLLAHVLDRLRPQAGRLAINANGDPGRLAGFGLPVIADAMPGFLGPLAGILAAMEWASRSGASAVLTVPCDTPFLPYDLAPRLAAVADGTSVVCAASAGRAHPVVALWPVALRRALSQALGAGVRKVEGWSPDTLLVSIDFAFEAIDPFLNVNTAADVASAERSISARAAG